MAIVIGNGGRDGLRDHDLAWQDFLVGMDGDTSGVEVFHQDSMATINVLFSSGTTGDPKAIPWNQTTAIKSAADGYFHHDSTQGTWSPGRPTWGG